MEEKNKSEIALLEFRGPTIFYFISSYKLFIFKNGLWANLIRAEIGFPKFGVAIHKNSVFFYD